MLYPSQQREENNSPSISTPTWTRTGFLTFCELSIKKHASHALTLTSAFIPHLVSCSTCSLTRAWVLRVLPRVLQTHTCDALCTCPGKIWSFCTTRNPRLFGMGKPSVSCASIMSQSHTNITGVLTQHAKEVVYIAFIRPCFAQNKPYRKHKRVHVVTIT